MTPAAAWNQPDIEANPQEVNPLPGDGRRVPYGGQLDRTENAQPFAPTPPDAPSQGSPSD